jgi:hypothetical protein
MAAAERSNKDKQMASRMKAEGVTRKAGRCPFGCFPVGLNNSMYAHIAFFQHKSRLSK